MLRMKTAGVLIVLIAIAKVNWIVAIGIIVVFAGWDFLLQKEDEESLQEVKDYIAAMKEQERLRQKDLKFSKIMEENE